MRFIAIITDGKVAEVRQVSEDAIVSPDALPVVFDPVPEFNAATQKAVRGQPVVEGSQVRVPWIVSPLTQPELDAIAEDDADRQFKQSINAALAKLEGGTATTAEMRGYLAKVLRWIKRQEGL